ncbi:MAG: hypothetical protein U0531_20930 [Dehalococcoidia bacterium]
MIPALLSRCRVVVLRALTEDELAILVGRALSDSERGLGGQRLSIEDGALEGADHGGGR